MNKTNLIYVFLAAGIFLIFLSMFVLGTVNITMLLNCHGPNQPYPQWKILEEIDGVNPCKDFTEHFNTLEASNSLQMIGIGLVVLWIVLLVITELNRLGFERKKAQENIKT